MGRPIVTNGILCVRGGDALFPNRFGEDLFGDAIYIVKIVYQQMQAEKSTELVVVCRYSQL